MTHGSKGELALRGTFLFGAHGPKSHPILTPLSQCLFDSTEESIRELHTRENWEISQERGHTALPLLFQNMVLSLLSTLKEVVHWILVLITFQDKSYILKCKLHCLN